MADISKIPYPTGKFLAHRDIAHVQFLTHGLQFFIIEVDYMAIGRECEIASLPEVVDVPVVVIPFAS
jgi:hypothetical protein